MAPHAAGPVVTSFRQSETFAGDPILAAKITAPDVPEWALRRPRVTGLVALGARCCPLTVVTGPAARLPAAKRGDWAAVGLGRVVGAASGIADALGYDIDAALGDPDG